jgi:hypothetical protein
MVRPVYNGAVAILAKLEIYSGGSTRMSDENPLAALQRSRDEVALEMMKFIAVTTGYGKGGGAGAGFTSKSAKTAEEYADALLQLFERCRSVILKEKE